MTLITATNGAGTSAPDLVLGYETTVESQSIVHQIIGGGIAITLAAGGPRSGKLALFFTDESAAFACLNLHRQATTFALSGAERATVEMTYAVAGSVSLSLTEDRKRFEVSVTYQEVET